MNTNKFYKLASQALKKSDLNRIMNKMEESSDSDSDSDSETYTSAKQNIRRSISWEKPACKKRVLDKDFRVRKPCIYPKTGDWPLEYLCHPQEHKSEFREGPYGYDVALYEDEWTTGRHAMNAMDSTIDDLTSESNNNNKLINEIPIFSSFLI